VLRERLIREILGISLADNVKARRLGPDGSYHRLTAEERMPPVRSQVRFMELAREKAQAGPGIAGPATGGFVVRTTAPGVTRGPGQSATGASAQSPPAPAA